MQQPLQVTMRPLQPGGSLPPLPLRWAEAVRNAEAAQRSLEALSSQLDGALWLDEEAWQSAVPQAQVTAALHGQQRKIAELERQLATVVARLEESERTRRAAEARVAELSEEVENHSNVFQLHYSELLRKDAEIHDLQAVVQALSLGGPAGGGGGGGSSDGGGGSPGSRLAMAGGGRRSPGPSSDVGGSLGGESLGLPSDAGSDDDSAP